MALSRKIKKVTPRSFKRQEGGLVQYGAGGAISSVGGIMAAVPTPWTQIGGMALNFIGGIVENKEQSKLQEEGIKKQMTVDGRIAQSMVNNPFAQTFAMGGEVGDPTKFENWKQKTSQNEDLQQRARMQYYNNKLDSALFANEFDKYKTMKNSLPSLDRRHEYADSLMKTGAFTKSINAADVLTPTEMQDYMPAHAKQMTRDVTGTKSKDPYKYGLRNSFTNPLPRHETLGADYTMSMDMSWDPIKGYSSEANMINRAIGGYIPGMQPNVEVEGGEVIQGKNKSIAEVKGPKHKDGGVKLFMENGGRVFSDKLIDPLTGKTFAEGAKRYM